MTSKITVPAPVGLQLHPDPYLISLFFRPQQIAVLAKPTVTEPDWTIWGTHQRWSRQLAYLSEQGCRLAEVVVDAIQQLTPSSHPANDYPSVSLLSDDQMVVSVHPLDRPTAWAELLIRLRQHGFQPVVLPPGGEPLN